MVNKLKIINDPVHGFIRLPHPIIYDIIEHPYFQRLRRIGQTGLLNIIFPGATHTRFAHALGAMHLMHSAIETLRWKGTAISEEEEIGALAAILLHDVGHGPFSHALERQVITGWHHERLSLELMQKINQDLDGQLEVALQMFQGVYPRRFFNQLISSQLDMDRMDYLKRDSFYTGVAEGNVNAQRLISMFNVADDQLVVDAKGIFSIEHFLTSRMLMYWQVYYHKTATTAERLLVALMARAKELAGKSSLGCLSDNLDYFFRQNHLATFGEEAIKRFTALDDQDVWQAMKGWQQEEDFLLRSLSGMILNRHLPKTEISTLEFSETYLEKRRQLAVETFDHPDAARLVQTFKRTVVPYEEQAGSIRILTKGGEVLPLTDFDGSILSAGLTQPAERFFIYYPNRL